MVQIKSILCPLDFSAASFRAADYAIALSKKYGAELHFLHVVSPVLYSAEPYAFGVAEILSSMEKHASKEMAGVTRKARVAGVAFNDEIRTGDVEHEIRRAADEAKADLIVMGTHGHRGLEKWFIGSVTERMLRRSKQPILTLRDVGTTRKTRLALRRILLTTDFSKGTKNAVAYAFSLAQESQAKVTLLHVINDHVTDTAGQPALAVRTRQQLEKLIPREALDWCDADVRVEFGNPYERILDVLTSRKIDLLVMNIHGKGMLDRALLGSTAERLVRSAGCPIVLIPPMQLRKRRKAQARKNGDTSS